MSSEQIKDLLKIDQEVEPPSQPLEAPVKPVEQPVKPAEEVAAPQEPAAENKTASDILSAPPPEPASEPIGVLPC